MTVARTLVDLLQRLAATEPDRVALTFAGNDDATIDRVTYSQLDTRARAIAATLQARGPAGERALLAFSPGLEFVAAFFGCLYAGWIAVPVPHARAGSRVESIARDAEPHLTLTNAATRDFPDSLASEFRPRQTNEIDVALLQYTSGSTAAPRGVVLSHANLLHNTRAIATRFGMSRDSRGVSWLPHFHDMGLVGGILVPLVSASHCTLLSPLTLARKPLRWLDVIARERGSVSGGPNFAFDLCVDRTTAEERRALDLSSWEVAFVGAEPVRAATLERFASAFAVSGFRRNALYPCYGLAEATLMVSGGDRLAGPHLSDATTVGCGHPVDGLSLGIVDAETGAACAPGQTGEITVEGPSVARGYWRDAPRSSALRTGDVGHLEPDGELFVTGRLKAVIALNGRKIHAEDVERTVLTTNLVRGAVAAVAIDTARSEELAVFVEIERNTNPATCTDIARTTRLAIASELQVPTAYVVLVKSGRLPRTTSGKVRRDACRQAYIEGVLPTLLVSPLPETR
jgi:acyl-CoA synthetase (AMP-forming)/AMP-acid ligase II